jgi:hypothetical protein
MSDLSRVPLRWNGERVIGWADIDVSVDGTEYTATFQVDDPEIREILFPDLSTGVSVEVSPRPPR